MQKLSVLLLSTFTKKLSKANIIKTDIYIPDEYMNHFSLDGFLVHKITCKRNNCFLNKPKTQHVWIIEQSNHESTKPTMWW